MYLAWNAIPTFRALLEGSSRLLHCNSAQPCWLINKFASEQVSSEAHSCPTSHQIFALVVKKKAFKTWSIHLPSVHRLCTARSTILNHNPATYLELPSAQGHHRWYLHLALTKRTLSPHGTFGCDEASSIDSLSNCKRYFFISGFQDERCCHWIH